MFFSKNKNWSALFALWTLHGLVALLQFTSLPSEGFSPTRAAMIFLFIAWVVCCAVLTLSAWKQSARVFAFIQNPNVKDNIFIASALILFARIFLAFLHVWLVAAENFSYSGYVRLLDPFLNLIAFISAEIIALVLFLAFRNLQISKNEIQGFVKKIIVVLSALGLVALLVYLTGWGVKPGYKGDWSVGIPAVALMEWQILLACIFCVAMALLEAEQKLARIKNPDMWISLVIWVVTVLLWLSQPVIPSSSALTPREPNFEIYPFNDAQVYDQYAQTVLIGEGYGNQAIPQRPLYIVALTFMHLVAGQNYEGVVILQTLLLAFFPVLLYLFGKEFFGRPIGISAALLVILRDVTSNLSAPVTGNLSYSKLYLAEMPTAITLVLFLWVGLRWIKSGFPLYLGFLAGGILGVGMLIRTQVVVAFPVLIFFALLTRPRYFLPALKSAALGVFVLVLVVSPWLARNWRMTGELIFDNPASQTINLALRYSRLNGHEPPDILPLPGESNTDYNNRMLAIANYEISSNPLGAAKGVAGFFINHGINNILLFPLRYELKNFGELLQPADGFWQRWYSRMRLPQMMLLGFYIFLFGLGVTVAWQRLGWLGFLPLSVNLAYNLWTSIALLSGQRFMLTMDWSIAIYYMIGLFGLLSAFIFALERGREVISKWHAQNQLADVIVSQSVRWQTYALFGVLFFGIGASLWGVEMIFPRRYISASQSELYDRIVASSSFNLDAACFEDVISANQLQLTQGRALYPRYYWADDGETFTDSFGYKKSDEGRLVFEMIGGRGSRVVMPIADPVDFFPHAADVVLGRDSQGGVWFALVGQGEKARLYLSDIFDDAVCR